jgi:hypothetical protein
MTALNITVQHLRSNTAGHVPTAAQLQQGQIAINIADKKMYTLDSTGAVQQINVALSQLSTVAQTGSYNDLTNKPDIQSQYVLPTATSTVLGGVKIPASGGIAIDGSGNLTNTGVLSVNSRIGAVTLTATDVGLPTDLLSGASGTLATKYLPSSITGGLSYQGTWNASTNSPSLASGGVGPGGTQLPNGDYYIVATAGSTALDGISTWTVGDLVLVSNGVWTRIANSGTTVTSVSGKTGAVTLVPGDITGLATVASTGSYNDLTNKPTAYSLPIATTSTLGGVILNTTAQQAGNAASGKLATVATSGSYNDLLNLPANPSTARLPVNLQGNPNVLNEVFYLFTDGCQFPQNWTGSLAFAELISGTTATIRIMRYPAATPTTGTQVGTVTIDTVNGNSFTSTGSSTTFAAGDKLSYQFATTNISLITITIRGTWQS